jgi:DNA-binding MarR family transcriptional regulator
MASENESANAAALTALILEVFRLNGRLLSAGDKLVKDIGLTSARWQVLGAIHLAEAPQTVSSLARSMGLTRQGVQRVVNELDAEGIVVLSENPAHRRAQLVQLTRKGRNLYDAAQRRQAPWVNDLARGHTRAELRAASTLLSNVRGRIDAGRKAHGE